MSYRDRRNLIEYTRALGYSRLVSMESFSEPNFKLVAEILVWLVERYEPNAGLPTDIDTENDRVLFVKAVAQFMAAKASVRLNTKKLYRADGHAVKELLKVVSVLYTATQTETIEQSEEDTSGITASSFDLTDKVKDLKATRRLASEITSKGAALYELLGNELDLRVERTMAINRPLEIDAIEAGLRKKTASVVEQYNHAMSLIDNLGADEANLASKIEKKKLELERNQKRLKSLQSVRPHFMDEYEKLEGDLAVQYEVYVEKFRNLMHLEHQLEAIHQAEQNKMEETEQSLKRMQERLLNDQGKDLGGGRSMLPGSSSSSDDDDDDDLEDDADGVDMYEERPSAPQGGEQAVGNFYDGAESDSELKSLDDSASSGMDGEDDDLSSLEPSDGDQGSLSDDF